MHIHIPPLKRKLSYIYRSFVYKTRINQIGKNDKIIRIY